MGCCRKRPMAQSVQNTTGPCKKIEQGGASLRFWIKNIDGQHKLYLRGDDGKFIEVTSYLSVYNCDGPVTRMIANNLSRIIIALRSRPSSFLRRGSAGISLTELLQAADEDRKSRRPTNARRVHPFSRR